MKTPDEIKKALNADSCSDCPYECLEWCCSRELAADALSYIKQLESRVKTDKE